MCAPFTSRSVNLPWRTVAILFVFVASLAASLDTVQAQLTVLHRFSNDADNGAYPTGTLIRGSNGNYYGTTGQGLGYNFGGIFRLGPNRSFKILRTFDGGADGGTPSTPVQGTDGNFYGTTAGFNPDNPGTVFRLTPAGALTTLHNFSGLDGRFPAASLVQGEDGFFYGTTQVGGSFDGGTVFRISPDGGTYNVLVNLGGTDGEWPVSSLAPGQDGFFYGVTERGGAYGNGTVFQISPDGKSYRVLHDFTSSDGSHPRGALTLLPGSAAFYGVASADGANGYGTVFRVGIDGTFVKLHDFDGQDGSYPQNALTYATDGAFYGTATTSVPGGMNSGVIYRLSPDGGFSASRVFDDLPGQFATNQQPTGPLLQIADGTFLGATSIGGYFGSGTIFQLNLGLPNAAAMPVPVITSPALQTAIIDEPFAYGITATNLPTSFEASPLPPGVNFDPVRGLIAGQIPAEGTYVINLAATNDSGTGTGTLVLTVQAPAVVPALVLRTFAPTASYLRYLDGQFAVYLTEPTRVDLQINYSVSGTAVSDVDYYGLSGVLTIPAGDTYGIVTVRPSANLYHKGKRTVLLKLAPGSGYKIRTHGAAKVTATYN